MPTFIIDGVPLTAPLGARLSDVLPDHHDFPCGGRGSCGKCRVTVTGAVSTPSAEELTHLTDTELAAGLRLACCTRIEGDCKLTTARSGEAQICTSGHLSQHSDSPLFSAYGVAVDIGTTTLAARLYGKSGLLAEASSTNPQGQYGADVISRIEKVLAGAGDALATCLRGGVAKLLEELAAEAGIAVTDIDALVLTGNTAMLYLLTQTNPECLSHAPFQADRLFGETLSAAQLVLPCPDASVYLPPCISAFVGADTVTALLSAQLCEGDGPRLLADVGTNGELALWHNGQLTCCSTAAGPAFEGAGLSMGMGGRAGAVDHLWLEDGLLRAHVLGGGAPTGICGSGVVDALACLLELDWLDETGRLKTDPAVLSLPVCLKQQDIRMIQLAKSAIHAGLCTLLRVKGLREADVERLDVAGGFGSFLDVKNAGRMGLIPPALVPKVRVLGNAALAGASMLLLDSTLRENAGALAAQATTLDLATHSVFLEEYTEGMLFAC